MNAPIRTGYVPEQYLDDICPKPRDTPNAWVMTTADGDHHLADFDPSSTSDQPGVRLFDGDVQDFCLFRRWPHFTLALNEEGYTTSTPPHPDCSYFWHPGDPDTLAMDLAELANNMREGGDHEAVVEGFDWSDPIPYRFAVAPDGSATFVPVEEA